MRCDNLRRLEALQKALCFHEAQQSGPLSPKNRVEWHGPPCLKDATRTWNIVFSPGR